MLDFNKYYNNIYIIESYNHWDLSKIDFNFDKDLVLTFDFKLKREIQLKKGSCFYIDNIVEPLEMEENNHLASVFFKNWHSDEKVVGEINHSQEFGLIPRFNKRIIHFCNVRDLFTSTIMFY